jgi:WD40 repeat protein
MSCRSDLNRARLTQLLWALSLLFSVAGSTAANASAQIDLEHDASAVDEVVWSPDGHQLAIATMQALWLYDADSGRVTRVGTCEQPAHNPRYSADGSMLAYSRTRGEVVITDLTTRRADRIFQTTAQRVHTIVFGHSDQRLAIAVSTDDPGSWPEIQIWDIGTVRQISRFEPLMNWPASLAFVPESNSLWVTGTNVMYDAFMNFAHLYDFTSGALIMRLTDTLADYDAPVIQDAWVVTANTDEIDPFAGTHWLELWNTRIGQPPEVVPLENVVYTIALASSGNAMAAAIHGGTIQVWRGTTSVFRISEDRPMIGLSSVNGLALSPEGDHLAVSIEGESMPIVDLWDVTSGTQLASLDTSDWLSQCEGA